MQMFVESVLNPTSSRAPCLEKSPTTQLPNHECYQSNIPKHFAAIQATWGWGGAQGFVPRGCYEDFWLAEGLGTPAVPFSPFCLGGSLLKLNIRIKGTLTRLLGNLGAVGSGSTGAVAPFASLGSRFGKPAVPDASPRTLRTLHHRLLDMFGRLPSSDLTRQQRG